MTNSPEVLQATGAAKDVVLVTVLAALIRHHPNREAVLNSLRIAQTHVPGVQTPIGIPAADQAFQHVFLAYMSAIREAERTLPE